jgi:hypothetical protein
MVGSGGAARSEAIPANGGEDQRSRLLARNCQSTRAVHRVIADLESKPASE